MLIVGDSRVRELEKRTGDMVCSGWRVEFLHLPGAKLDQTVALIEEWRKNQYPDQPRLIILISIFHDLVVKKSRPDGQKFLKMAAGVKGNGPYPSLKGLEDKIRAVERKLKSWWNELQVLWIDPFPVDVRRWTEDQIVGGGFLSEEDTKECHQLTLDLADWLDRANCIGSRMKGMGDRFIPWFVFWNDQKRNDLNFSSFLKEAKEGKKFGWINRTRSVDGFLPSTALSRQTMKMFFRKAWQTVPNPASLVAPMAAKPSFCPRDGSESVYKSVDRVENPAPTPSDGVLGNDTPWDLGGLMKKMTEVDLLMQRQVHDNNVSGCENRPCKNIVLASEKEYSKTSYPCGHNWPFMINKDVEFLRNFYTCPVCDKDWSNCKVNKNSFHYYELHQ